MISDLNAYSYDLEKQLSCSMKQAALTQTATVSVK